MVLKHFILPEEHFKANLFFPHYDPTYTTHPLIKVKKPVDFKIHFRWLKSFLDHVFNFFFIKIAG